MSDALKEANRRANEQLREELAQPYGFFREENMEEEEVEEVSAFSSTLEGLIIYGTDGKELLVPYYRITALVNSCMNVLQGRETTR